MQEILWIFLTLLGGAGVVLLIQIVPWPLLLKWGTLTTAAGLLVGIPTGLAYHIFLAKIVKKKMPLPRFWWIFPARLHHHLSGSEMKEISIWFKTGAAGFFLTLAGCILWSLGLLQ